MVKKIFSFLLHFISGLKVVLTKKKPSEMQQIEVKAAG